MSEISFLSQSNNSIIRSGITADAPAAATTIATATALEGGLYKIVFWARQVGTPIPADVTNIDLRAAGGGFGSIVENSPPVECMRRLAANDVVLVRTGAGATAAGTRYAGFVSLTRVG